MINDENKDITIVILLIILCLAVIILLYPGSNLDESTNISNINNNYTINYEIDKYLPNQLTYNNESVLKEDVRYIVDQVNKDFKYRANDDDNILSNYDLANKGGDCLDWARYYKWFFEKRYNPRIEVMIYEKINYYEGKNKITASNGHAIVLVYDNKGNYCVIDQQNYWCG